MPVAVTVTGVTGFVAQELVKQLLSKGYNVRGTLRSAVDSPRACSLQQAVSHLPGTLELFQADLLQDGSFDDAIAGANYVYHVASPFFIQSDNPQKDLIDPAVQGTKNVLASVAKHKGTVKRCVVTSSVCAVHDMLASARPVSGDKYSEADWNSTSQLASEPYWLSKVLAEKAAFEAAQAHGLDVVTILPNFVMGPPLTADAAGTSIGFFKAFLEAPGGQVPGGKWTMTDVRDVAAAHILAAETPSASGRYIVSWPHSTSARFITDTLKASISGLAVPDGEEQAESSNIDSSRVVRELGLSYSQPADTFRDMAAALVQLGIAKPMLAAG